ncbi:ImmA/IrrE family metallo-endopeptidase [Halobacillus litoralis]|uniref:ImmA/IrrE family metallo-endopeptidase n=1 Tax=Halobacillus litoralis TaxID=45668 RepID=UPI001CD6FB4B|nr:ImmA/IrrE family metallo-endopeptidase [Halobacillus litoralis]MCA1021827.1 ImmA/IrrE family metallo-endopeptidase [Halobacillus litoralis]
MIVLYFPNYTTTHLEDWVSYWYIRRGFLSPDQLKAAKIAKKMDIFVHRKPKPSSYLIHGRYKGITLDAREDKLVQKEQFYHELGHILRHVGIQSMMPQAFRELQERDARHFTLYAALPFHMVSKYDLSDEQIIERWVNDFKITSELSELRLNKIKERNFLYQN